MFVVTRHKQVPANTLIAACRPADPGLRQQTHLDCYTAEIHGSVAFSEFVEAFYTTLPFRMERRILAWVFKRPSTNDEAAALAAGDISRFAAWTVEARRTNEILMRDMANKTRSWLMVEPAAEAESTRLYFGSVVKPSVRKRTGKPDLGWAYRAFMPVHGAYSRTLLAAAHRQLVRTRNG